MTTTTFKRGDKVRLTGDAWPQRLRGTEQIISRLVRGVPVFAEPEGAGWRVSRRYTAELIEASVLADARAIDVDAICAWQAEVFPSATAQSVRAHLRREMLELEEAIDNASGDECTHGDLDAVAEEAADVVHLLAALCAAHGRHLGEAVAKKLAVNHARTWKAPDSLGVVEHVDDEE